MWAAEPAYRSQMTHIDGNIYALWDISVCHHCMYQSKFWINTEWLKNVGHDVPSTTEEFYEVLKTFKEQDANGNGDPNDEIPFSGAITGWNNSVDTFLMNAFIYNDRGSGYLNVVNDAVVPAFTQPEWRDGLTFFHRLYREGLLDHESFIQNVDQLAQLARAGDYNRLGVFPAGTPLMVVSGSGERKREFAALPPLTGPKGNNTAAFYPPGVAFGRGARYVISAESRMPQIAYRLGDFLLSEEAYYVTFFGEEGVNWRRANPGEVGVDGNPAIFKEINTPRNEPQQNQVLNHMVPVYVTQEQFLGRVTDISDPYYVEYWLERETTEHYDGHEPDQVLLPLKILIEDLAEYSELQVTVNAYRAESFARFVTGDWDLEGDWDAYLRELDQIGLDRYLQLTQEAWDRDYAD